MQEIRDNISYNAERVDIEVDCPDCKEKNPGNFDLCWSCGVTLVAPIVKE
jgi:hypothetical protein